MAKANKPTKLTTRQTFLSAAGNLKRESVKVEGMGTVCLRELSGRQMLRYNERIEHLKSKNGPNAEVDPESALRLMALLVSMSVCDEQGELLFTEEDVETLAETTLDKLSFLADRILRLSGINVDQAREVADNLKKALDSSTIVSPRSSENP